MASALQVTGVTKRYGPSRGVEDVSLQVERGEVLGLLGPNGAGKTTTLRVITGFLPANAGRVVVEGYDLWEEPYEVRRRVGYLPDNPPLYGDMTVWEYLNFMAELREVPRGRRTSRIDEVVERLQLEEVVGRLIGRLSRGFRQRVGLAQAVLHEPPVLVCDEPTVGLDPRQIAEMRELIRSFGREHAVLFSSHILSEVRVLCHRVAIMHRGHILAEGAPSELTGHLRGEARYRVAAAGPADEVAAAIRRLPGVGAVEAQPGADDAGVARLLVTGRADAGPEGGAKLGEALFAALAAGGWPVREMATLETTLEEVFLELTAGASGEADEGGGGS